MFHVSGSLLPPLGSGGRRGVQQQHQLHQSSQASPVTSAMATPRRAFFITDPNELTQLQQMELNSRLFPTAGSSQDGRSVASSARKHADDDEDSIFNSRQNNNSNRSRYNNDNRDVNITAMVNDKFREQFWRYEHAATAKLEREALAAQERKRQQDRAFYLETEGSGGGDGFFGSSASGGNFSQTTASAANNNGRGGKKARMVDGLPHYAKPRNTARRRRGAGAKSGSSAASDDGVEDDEAGTERGTTSRASSPQATSKKSPITIDLSRGKKSPSQEAVTTSKKQKTVNAPQSPTHSSSQRPGGAAFDDDLWSEDHRFDNAPILLRNIDLVCSWRPEPINRVYGGNRDELDREKARYLNGSAGTPLGEHRRRSSFVTPRPPRPPENQQQQQHTPRLLGGGVPPSRAEVEARHRHQEEVRIARNELARKRREMLMKATASSMTLSSAVQQSASSSRKISEKVRRDAAKVRVQKWFQALAVVTSARRWIIEATPLAAEIRRNDDGQKWRPSSAKMREEQAEKQRRQDELQREHDRFQRLHHRPHDDELLGLEEEFSTQEEREAAWAVVVADDEGDDADDE